MPPLTVAAFSFGDGVLTVLELAFFLLWIWIAVGVVFDIFRSSDLSNQAKAVWVLIVFVFPLLGALAYLIIRGYTMHEHQVQDGRGFGTFIQGSHGATPNRSGPSGASSAAGSAGAAGGSADDLRTLADLRDRELLTAEEFERAQARLLSRRGCGDRRWAACRSSIRDAAVSPSAAVGSTLRSSRAPPPPPKTHPEIRPTGRCPNGAGRA